MSLKGWIRVVEEVTWDDGVAEVVGRSVVELAESPQHVAEPERQDTLLTLL